MACGFWDFLFFDVGGELRIFCFRPSSLEGILLQRIFDDVCPRIHAVEQPLVMARVWMRMRKLIASTLEHPLGWTNCDMELRKRMGLCEGCEWNLPRNRLDMYLQTDL